MISFQTIYYSADVSFGAAHVLAKAEPLQPHTGPAASGALVEHRDEVIEIHRLDEMLLEAGFR